jgi:hypothetical protein
VSEQPVWSAEANRCSMISGATLIFTLAASAPLAWLAVTSEISGIRAFGLLVIPASIGAWVFATIRAVHLLELRFWQMRSTYVSLIFGLVSLGLILLHSVILLLSKDHPSVRADTTLYLAAALVATLATMWCAWYNWRAARSFSLAASLTMIQMIVSCSIVAVVLIWMGNRRRESD